MTNITAFAARQHAAARTDGAAQIACKIYLAGSMRMLAPDGEDILPSARKGRALVAYLCLVPTHRAARGKLAALLWDKADDLARKSLRQTLYELSSTPAAEAIRLDADYIGLDEKSCWIDVLADPGQHFERLLDDLDDVSEAFDHWLRDERSRRDDCARKLLHDRVVQLDAGHAPAEQRAAAARKLVAFDPTHERGICALMKALADLGDHIQALREYERCRNALRAVFDVGPSRETTSLYEAIRLASPRAPARLVQLEPAKIISLKRESFAVDYPREPSIAVLPFDNSTGDATHDFTIAGLADDLIGALTRMGFFVSSRLSARVFKHQLDRAPRDIGDLLDVRYLLSGSIRAAGSRLRLNVELTDTVRGTALWTTQFEEPVADVSEALERLAQEIARQSAPHVRRAELSRTRNKRPEQLNAYDYFLQAHDDMHNFSQSVFQRAEGMFDAALTLAPNYARALAWRAYWHVLRVGQGWSPDAALDVKLAGEFSDRALDADPAEAMAHGVHGHIAAYLHKDFPAAFGRFETALQLDPNAAPIWLWSAATRAWNGDGAGAVAEVGRGAALSPYDPLMYFSHVISGMAHLTNGHYERAVEFAYRSLRENRQYTSAHRLLVIGLMLAGRPDEARAAAHRLIAVEPGVTVAKFRSRYPGAATPHGEVYCRSLADAGLPLD
jgi:TolB-like protein